MADAHTWGDFPDDESCSKLSQRGETIDKKIIIFRRICNMQEKLFIQDSGVKFLFFIFRSICNIQEKLFNQYFSPHM